MELYQGVLFLSLLGKWRFFNVLLPWIKPCSQGLIINSKCACKYLFWNSSWSIGSKGGFHLGMKLDMTWQLEFNVRMHYMLFLGSKVDGFQPISAGFGTYKCLGNSYDCCYSNIRYPKGHNVAGAILTFFLYIQRKMLFSV